jgi:hypothetical protein
MARPAGEAARRRYVVDPRGRDLRHWPVPVPGATLNVRLDRGPGVVRVDARDVGAAEPPSKSPAPEAEDHPLTELSVDRAVYLVDDATKTYRYLRRNPVWRNLDPDDNLRNKRRLAGYTRVFPDGRTAPFRYRPPYTTASDQRGDERSRVPVDMEPDLARLHRTVTSFAALAGSAPPAQRSPAGAWGLSEVLAHLVYWHEHYVRVVRAQLAGRDPPLPDDTFKRLNAAAVEGLRGKAVPTLARRLIEAQTELERLAPGARAAGIGVRIKTGAKAWPWPDFLQRVEQHVRGHESNLSRDIQRRPKGTTRRRAGRQAAARQGGGTSLRRT